MQKQDEEHKALRNGKAVIINCRVENMAFDYMIYNYN